MEKQIETSLILAISVMSMPTDFICSDVPDTLSGIMQILERKLKLKRILNFASEMQ